MAATNQLHNLLWPQNSNFCEKVVKFYNQILHDMEMCRYFLNIPDTKINFKATSICQIALHNIDVMTA